MSVENPGGKRAWRGGYVCECQTHIIPIMEQRMIAAGLLKQSFDFYQYCYNSSVSASAGTHDLGGASDQAQDKTEAIKIMRECGGAAWARTPAEGFDYHSHLILNGCPHLSSGAYNQTIDYKNGRNGLANNGPDTGPKVPYITWQDAYYKYVDQVGGLFGMSTMKKWSRTKDRTIQANGAWNLVLIDDDDNSTIFFGPGTFHAWVGIQWTNGKPGNDPTQLRFRLVDDKDTSKVISSYPIKEVFNSNGTTFGHIDFVNSVGSGTRLRLFVQPFSQAITITSVTTRCLSD